MKLQYSQGRQNKTTRDSTFRSNRIYQTGQAPEIIEQHYKKGKFQDILEQLKEDSPQSLGSRIIVWEASCLPSQHTLYFQPAYTTKACTSSEEASDISVAITETLRSFVLFFFFNSCFNGLFHLLGMQWFRGQLFLQDLCCIHPCDPAAALLSTPNSPQALSRTLFSATGACLSIPVQLGRQADGNPRAFPQHLLHTLQLPRDMVTGS